MILGHTGDEYDIRRIFLTLGENLEPFCWLQRRIYQLQSYLFASGYAYLQLLLTGHCIRTLLVSNGGLESAKDLLTAYKQGKIGEMNGDLWNAKKVVDSTLHPGTYEDSKYEESIVVNYIFRYGRASFPPIQNVKLCSIKLGGHSWNADSWNGCELVLVLFLLGLLLTPSVCIEYGDTTLANHKPVPQRCDQQR